MIKILQAPHSDALRFVSEHRDELRALVAEHGMLLIRGLLLNNPGEIATVFKQLGTLITEREAFATRKHYAEGVYSESKWPANQPMCAHNELSYLLSPPSLLLYACLSPASKGGAAPLADASVIANTLPAALVKRFEEQGWQLVRNYNEDIGASLVDAFGTEDRALIEAYCKQNQIDFEWKEDGLRTRQRRAAIVRHPSSGLRCWFNQIAFLNARTLASELREYLVETYGEEGLPFDTRFGDGSPIGPDVVETINAVYEAHSVREPWQAGDLLLIDNIRIAHGRDAFEGSLELVVGLADPVQLK